jgi:hypothetical protein
LVTQWRKIRPVKHPDIPAVHPIDVGISVCPTVVVDQPTTLVIQTDAKNRGSAVLIGNWRKNNSVPVGTNVEVTAKKEPVNDWSTHGDLLFVGYVI